VVGISGSEKLAVEAALEIAAEWKRTAMMVNRRPRRCWRLQWSRFSSGGGGVEGDGSGESMAEDVLAAAVGQNRQRWLQINDGLYI
jgi:hypothetical protein